jgi:hypothetical protein
MASYLHVFDDDDDDDDDVSLSVGILPRKKHEHLLDLAPAVS